MQGEFWFELNFFVQLMTPLYQLLRMGDGVLPCMSKFINGFMKIPQRWDQVVELQQDVTKAVDGEGWKDPAVLVRLEDMKDKAASRLEYVWTPMMSAAWILDPEYRHVDVSKNPHMGRMMTDTTTMFKRLSTTATMPKLPSQRRQTCRTADRWARQEHSSVYSGPESGRERSCFRSPKRCQLPTGGRRTACTCRSCPRSRCA